MGNHIDYQSICRFFVSTSIAVPTPNIRLERLPVQNAVATYTLCRPYGFQMIRTPELRPDAIFESPCIDSGNTLAVPAKGRTSTFQLGDSCHMSYMRIHRLLVSDFTRLI